MVGGTMDKELPLQSLMLLGLRIQSSRDLEEARWLVKTAGPEAVRSASEALASRRYPSPKKVIAYLGLERGEAPQPPLPRRDAVKRRMQNRLLGWRAGSEDLLS